MKTIIALILITACCAVPARADDDGMRGFARFLGAVERAAQQGRDAHRAERDAYYEQDAAYDAQYASYQDYGPAIVDIRGDWVMRDGKVNRFQKTHQGYYVVPVGRGRGVHYVEIGENLYQDANSSGTYEIVDDNYMVWSSNDRRNKVIELFRR